MEHTVAQAIKNFLRAIEYGIFTETTKERLLEAGSSATALLEILKMPTPQTQKMLFRFACVGNGGPDRIRTDDPHNANVVRSQLRYWPIAPPIGGTVLL